MKATLVIYCDRFGKEHEALVTAENPLNEGYLSLVYVDEKLPEASNVVRMYDVPHMSKINEHRIVDGSRFDRDGNRIQVEEGNPNLPTYHLNCWKEKYEPSNDLPSDHPAYDHPHKKNVDARGNVVQIARPKYEADIAHHQRVTALEQGYEASSEGEPEVPTPTPDAPPAAPDASAPDAPSDASAPSAEDLDAVAAEQTAADATAGDTQTE